MLVLQFIRWYLKCIKWNVPVFLKQTYVYVLQINLIKYICRNLWSSAPSRRYAISIHGARKEFSICVLTFPHRMCFFFFFFLFLSMLQILFCLGIHTRAGPAGIYARGSISPQVFWLKSLKWYPGPLLQPIPLTLQDRGSNFVKRILSWGKYHSGGKMALEYLHFSSLFLPPTQK